MITPFEREAAREFIGEVAEYHPDLAVYHVNEIAFLCVLEEFTEADMKLVKKLMKLSDEELQEMRFNDDDDYVDSEIGTEVWTAACLCDTVMNGTDYSRYCTGYEEIYQKAAETLKADLFKKKFLSKRPVHNIPEIMQNAVDALDYVLGISNESELMEEMRRRGIYEDWSREIIELQNRLAEHSP